MITPCYHVDKDIVDYYISLITKHIAQDLIDSNLWGGKKITKNNAWAAFFWNFGNCITKVEELIKHDMNCEVYTEDLPEDLEIYLHDNVPYAFWDKLKELSDEDSLWGDITEKELRLDGWKINK